MECAVRRANCIHPKPHSHKSNIQHVLARGVQLHCVKNRIGAVHAETAWLGGGQELPATTTTHHLPSQHATAARVCQQRRAPCTPARECGIGHFCGKRPSDSHPACHAATQGHLHAGTRMWDWSLAEACIRAQHQLLGFASNCRTTCKLPRACEVSHWCGSCHA